MRLEALESRIQTRPWVSVTCAQEGVVFFLIRSEVGGLPIEVKRRFHDLDDLDHKVGRY
jgi:hypothetical protein